MAEGAVLTRVKIDINPDGILFYLEGLDSDLANLIEAAGSFTALPAKYRALDTSDITLRSDRALLFVPRAPALVATDTVQGTDVNISFPTNKAWELSFAKVLVNGVELANGSYTVVSGVLTILAASFPTPGTYAVTVKATDFADATVSQVVLPVTP